MATKTTPIKEALGEDGYDGLTTLQQALVDFADMMHSRLKQFNADDDVAVVIDNNVGQGHHNIARLLSNVAQLAKADAQAIYSQTAAADTANLAMILDLVHAERFTA